MKSTRMIELRTTMPAPAMKPIIDVAVKNACSSPCAGRMPTSENGIAIMMTSGVVNDWNQPTTSDVDQHQHHGEGESQVAKHFIGDVPLAVPLHRVVIAIVGRRRACAVR